MFGFLRRKKDPDEEYRTGPERRQREAAEAAPFRMTVQDVFSIHGRGTVVSGTVERGAVRVGDRLIIVGQAGRIPARADGLEKFQAVLTSARTGDQIGLLMRGVTKDQVFPGDILTSL